MEKYATYQIFENIVTGEIRRVPLENSEGLTKLAEDSDWKELTEEPTEEN